MGSEADRFSLRHLALGGPVAKTNHVRRFHDVIIDRSQLQRFVLTHHVDWKKRRKSPSTQRQSHSKSLPHPVMSDPPRILIVTAAFGEGHNSAARNLALALDAAGACTRVSDPCVIGMPRLTDLLSRGYRLATTHLPQVWAWIYRSTDRCDFSRQRGPVMRMPERSLAAMIEDFQPVAVVSTYPLYPYFLARIFAQSGKSLPVFTVVTDSIEINAAWLRAPSDWWLVTDPITRDAMIRKGLAAEKICDTGFPVHPGFAESVPVSGRGWLRSVPRPVFPHREIAVCPAAQPGAA